MDRLCGRMASGGRLVIGLLTRRLNWRLAPPKVGENLQRSISNRPQDCHLAPQKQKGACDQAGAFCILS